jgi:FkbM family methyltransferase
MTSITDLLNHGWSLHQAGNHGGAEAVYRQALQAAPDDANAWCYLGMACHDQDRLDEAVNAYRRAIQLRPNFPIAFNNLGNTLRLQRRLDEALASFDYALRLKPDYVNAHKNKGTALVWEGQLDEALASYQRALELAPDDAETHKNLGVIWLLQGKFTQGWREYAWRWKTDEASLPTYQQPLWKGDSLDSRTILLTAEQGLGDTIHFIRYAAVLKQRFQCQVVAACPRALLPLLRTCPGIDVLVAQDEPLPPFDVFAPLLNVPGILGDHLGTFPADVPYLRADPALVARWQAELSRHPGFKVGLVWQGNRKHQADRMRSMPLREFGPLGQLRGVQLFSLQKYVGLEQLESLAGLLDVIPLGDQLDEETGAFMDTAAVMRNLDLLITSDTSLAHLAGALGVPVWVALSYVPDWRWLLDRDDTPWYPTMRLFRQSKPGDWPSVFDRMADELRKPPRCLARKTYADYRLAASGINRLTRGRQGLLLYNRHDVYIGRSVERYGEFSEGEAELFRQLVRPGNVVVEAGAHIGIHTLTFSELVGDTGKVYAFEPQRVLFQVLCGNVALNSRTNVFARCEAVGEAPGEIVVPVFDYRQDNNFGGLGLGSYQSGERVPVATIDRLGLPRCDLVKVDVEGMELSVLKGAAETIRQYRPLLYVENDRAEKSPALLEYLLALGYDLYWHLPPLYSPANFFHNEVNEFGNIVSVNVLGVHASVKSQITGLRRIRSPQDDWKTL